MNANPQANIAESGGETRQNKANGYDVSIARLLYASTIFLSSLLLFLIQPVLANLLLPWFGGSAGIWTTSMVFFQTMLLAGYVYAHWSATRLPDSVHLTLHMGLVGASLFLLPVEVAGHARPLADSAPVASILAVLLMAIGLPYFLLSATSPLVQSWYARTGGTFPYRLYAISNLASLGGLLAYPLLIEPLAGKRLQLRAWSVAYAVFGMLMIASALLARRGERPRRQSAVTVGIDWWLWIILSAIPSALWLAVSYQLSHSVAAVPLLWVFPLSLYLLSLILVFAEWYPRRLLRWVFPPAVIAISVAPYLDGWLPVLGLSGLGLFTCSMVCHGELVLRKPAADRLTGFYLAMAAGGAAGGAFVSLIAPLVFGDFLELPLALVASVLVAVALLYGFGSRKHVLRLVLVSSTAFLAAVLTAASGEWKQRNFYGVLGILTRGEGDNRYRALFNGTVLHGVQYLPRERSREATTYFSALSGIGIELRKMNQPERRVGIIGLGVGTMAAYARAGDVFRFYEINPLVIRIARESFRFLSESDGRIEVLEGDARLTMEREPPQQYDLFAVDAFSGDAIPIHLLTREAFSLYAKHLKPQGVLAVHVSSKFLRLAPVVIRAGAAIGWEPQVVMSMRNPAKQITGATWVILRPGGKRTTQQGVWTDDYTNLIEVLK